MKQMSLELRYDIASSFEQVCNAIWHKASFCPQVAAVDVLHREVREGKLYSTRLLTTTFQLPKFIQWISKGIHTHALEVSEMNPVTKQLNQYFVNVSLQQWLTCREHVLYTPCLQSKSTLYQNNVEFSFHRFVRKVQHEFMNEFQKNSEIGKQALLKAIEFNKHFI